MNIGVYLAFVVAAAFLIVVPGPTAMLVTSTSLRYGLRAGLTAVAGSTCAVALQLTVVVAGLTSLLALVGASFQWIRWVGAAYLVYLGIRAWISGVVGDFNSFRGQSYCSQTRDFGRGFLVTLTNPKTLLFLGAFLPQFVNPAEPELGQLLILSVSFLAIAAILDSGWALLASRLGTVMASLRARRVVDLASGSILVTAGLALALMRRAE